MRDPRWLFPFWKEKHLKIEKSNYSKANVQCQQRATPRPSPTTFWLLCFLFGKYHISEKEKKLSPSSNILSPLYPRIPNILFHVKKRVGKLPEISIWVFPKMVVPPKHPKWSFLVGKYPWLLGKPTILGNPHTEPFPQNVFFWAVAQMLGQICTDRRHQKLWRRHQHTQHQRIGGIGKAGDLSQLETKKNLPEPMGT